jgi:TusA-related sulfurtransferase
MARRAMAGLGRDELLVVYATDPEAPLDLAAWAEDEGHGFVASERVGWTEIKLRKGGP